MHVYKAPTIRRVIGDESSRWKTVTLKILNTEQTDNDQIDIPLMQATIVHDVKLMVSEQCTVPVTEFDFYEKIGCRMKRLRAHEEIPTKVLVKGLKNFARREQEYPHPILIIGAGHLGLRQAIRLERMKHHDYALYDRKTRVGGNAWNGIANRWSKLQSEAPHYQLNWDAFDGNAEAMLPIDEYSCWPGRDEILAHFEKIVTDFNCWPNMYLGTQITDMEIVPALPGKGEESKHFIFRWETVGSQYDKTLLGEEVSKEEFERKEGTITISNSTYYPGALAVPHRKTYPGEEIFGGQIGYGVNDEFDYEAARHQMGIIVGFGATCIENIRTCSEHGAFKMFVIARHHNLLLPRCVSWYINQTQMPAPAATCLTAMQKMYNYYQKSHNDVWGFFSVTANADRSVASIKQYTRWGIGDAAFICVYYDRAEVIEGELKRLKHRTGILNTGRVIEDVDHLNKVLGFDSDFGVDKLMKTKVNIGFWPDGDYRRWIGSDQSAIDASRFGGTAIAPYAATITFWPLHFFRYPTDAKQLLSTGLLAVNHAKPELGSAAYHYDPRTAATCQVTYGGSFKEIQEFDFVNSSFKKGALWKYTPPEVFIDLCKKDWEGYIVSFEKIDKMRGLSRPPPEYPYTAEYLHHLCRLEQEDGERQQMIMQKNAQGKAERDKERQAELEAEEAAAAGGTSGSTALATSAPAQEEIVQAAPAVELAPAPAPKALTSSAARSPSPKIKPGSDMSLAAAKEVFRARGRSPGNSDPNSRHAWLQQANGIRDYILATA